MEIEEEHKNRKNLHRNITNQNDLHYAAVPITIGKETQYRTIRQPNKEANANYIARVFSFKSISSLHVGAFKPMHSNLFSLSRTIRTSASESTEHDRGTLVVCVLPHCGIIYVRLFCLAAVSLKIVAQFVGSQPCRE